MSRSLYAHISAEGTIVSNQELNLRDDRVRSLALKIASLMRSHINRAEAVDAYDMAKIIFRRSAVNRPDLTLTPESEESLSV